MDKPSLIGPLHISGYHVARIGNRLTALNAQGEAVEAVVVPVDGLPAMWEAFLRVQKDGITSPLIYWDAMIAAANG